MYYTESYIYKKKILNINIGQTTKVLIGDWNTVTKKFIEVFTTEKFVRLPVAGRNSVIHTIGIICTEYKIRPSFH